VPRSCPPEFRRKVLDLLKAGRTVAQLANDLQISGQTIYVWRRQEAIDNGLLPGVTSAELAELSKARRLMRRAGIRGLPTHKYRRPLRETPTAGDLVNRQLDRDARDLLWVTDITDTRPVRARSTALSCSTRSPAASSAGPSTRHKPRHWSRTP
jgi:transposase